MSDKTAINRRQTLAVLKGAREILTDPAHWTKGKYARDYKGFAVDWHSKDATCFCAMGALNRAHWNGGTEFLLLGSASAFVALHKAMQEISESDYLPDSLSDWNDDPARTHDEVLAAFDLAITKQEKLV